MTKKINALRITVILLIIFSLISISCSTAYGADKQKSFTKEIFRKNGIVITATGLTDSYLSWDLNLKITNNSGRDITVQTRNEAINGLMISGIISSNVLNGKSTYDEVSFLKSEMSKSDIFQIGTIDFDFHIFDSDTWESIMDDTHVSIEIDESVNQYVNSAGNVLYNYDGIKIVLKGLSDSNNGYSKDIIVYMENNSDRALCVQTRDCSVNDIMISPIFSHDILPGYKAFTEISFDNSSLEKAKISSINKVELKFNVFNWSDYEDEHLSDTITFYPEIYSRKGWIKSSNEWLYRESDGSIKMDEWAEIDSKFYYFNEYGYMQTGWQQINGTWYYLGDNGAMATGWRQIDGAWYYFTGSGAMTTGWAQVSGKWYFFKSGGAMATGWRSVNGTWYYFGTSGAMQTGWIQDGNTWYYMKPSGAMAANEYVDGYWINANGSWNYPHRASWHGSGNRWWYGDASGWYARNATYRIDGVYYHFDDAGWME